MAQRPLYLDTLAAMSDDWNETTNAMLSVLAALLMQKMGAYSLTVCLDDAAAVVEQYEIDRTYQTTSEGKTMMTISVTERKEVTSDENRPIQDSTPLAL